MINKLLKLPFLFGVGGTVYYLMEIIWRGYSHWSMFALSGVCFIIIDLLNQAWKNIRSLILLIILSALIITALEFVTGLIVNLWLGLGVWDYSKMPGNLHGIICPQFSLIWAAVAAVYDLFVHPYILDALHWLSQNLAVSFFIGLFFGVFLIDVAHSAQIVARLKKFAEDNHVEVRYEALKADIRRRAKARAAKYNFFRPFRSDLPLSEHLKAMYESLEERRKHK